MIKSFKIILLLITSLFILPTLSLARQFKVTRVYEGDTIKAKGYAIVIKVRLAGIEAPETCFGFGAKFRKGAVGGKVELSPAGVRHWYGIWNFDTRALSKRNRNGHQ